jgi:hypothetical protein
MGKRMAVSNEVRIQIVSNALSLGAFTAAQMQRATGLNPRSIQTVLQRLKRQGYLVSEPVAEAPADSRRPSHRYCLTPDAGRRLELARQVEVFYTPLPPLAPPSPTGRHYSAAGHLLAQLEREQVPAAERAIVIEKIRRHLELAASEEGLGVRRDAESDILAAQLALLQARLATCQGHWAEATKSLQEATATFSACSLNDLLAQAQDLQADLWVRQALAGPAGPRPSEVLAHLLTGTPDIRLSLPTVRALLQQADQLAASQKTPVDTPISFAAFPVGHHLGFFEDKIIVVGFHEDVVKILPELLTLSQKELWKPSILDWWPAQRKGLMIYPYPVPSDKGVEETVKSINKKAEEVGALVFAEPNYVIGHPCIVPGSPLDKPEGQAQGDFWEQWLFGSIQLNREGFGVPTDKIVHIGVFDTSPFPNQGRWECPWIEPMMVLDVLHLLESSEATPLADHGLFVSSLIHAVAPKSQIHLIQVLDGNARGDLMTLIKALNRFIVERLTESGRTLDNVVINLSLGISETWQPDRLGLKGEVSAFEKRLAGLVQGYKPGGSQAMSLKVLAFGAQFQKAIVVAAAGDDSRLDQVAEANIPAAYDSVIGVAASNRMSERACFSNKGDVAAPGGYGLMRGSGYEDALIGLVWHTAESHYAYWTGTSFAAPLVSGLAALLLRKGVPAGEVYDKIKNSTVQVPDPALGAGIINVTKSLV